MTLDSIDARLLDTLQEDCSRPLESLAAAVGLSASSVQRRIRHLRDSGVIEREVAVVDPIAVGREMCFIVEVAVERERRDLLDRFKRDLTKLPEVQQCYYVTGDTDFVLVVTARNMADYESFTRRAFFDNPNLRSFETKVVMSTVKRTLTVPVAGHTTDDARRVKR